MIHWAFWNHLNYLLFASIATWINTLNVFVVMAPNVAPVPTILKIFFLCKCMIIFFWKIKQDSWLDREIWSSIHGNSNKEWSLQFHISQLLLPQLLVCPFSISRGVLAEWAWNSPKDNSTVPQLLYSFVPSQWKLFDFINIKKIPP